MQKKTLKYYFNDFIKDDYFKSDIQEKLKKAAYGHPYLRLLVDGLTAVALS